MTEWLVPGHARPNLTSAETRDGLASAADVAVRAGEATPRLEELPPEAAYARAGFLGYVAGRPEERASVPRLDLPDDIILMPLRGAHSLVPAGRPRLTRPAAVSYLGHRRCSGFPWWATVEP